MAEQLRALARDAGPRRADRGLPARLTAADAAGATTRRPTCSCCRRFTKATEWPSPKRWRAACLSSARRPVRSPSSWADEPGSSYRRATWTRFAQALSQRAGRRLRPRSRTACGRRPAGARHAADLGRCREQDGRRAEPGGGLMGAVQRRLAGASRAGRCARAFRAADAARSPTASGGRSACSTSPPAPARTSGISRSFFAAIGTAALAARRQRSGASGAGGRPAAGPREGVETRAVDLSAALDPPAANLCAGRDLVTASALLDLVSEHWLHALAGRCRDAATAVLFALTYNGDMQLLASRARRRRWFASWSIAISGPTRDLARRSDRMRPTFGGARVCSARVRSVAGAKRLGARR